LRARILHTDRLPEIDSQLVRRLPRLRKELGLDDPADADIDLGKIVVADLVHRGSQMSLFEVTPTAPAGAESLARALPFRYA